MLAESVSTISVLSMTSSVAIAPLISSDARCTISALAKEQAAGFDRIWPVESECRAGIGAGISANRAGARQDKRAAHDAQRSAGGDVQREIGRKRAAAGFIERAGGGERIGAAAV